MAVLLYKDHYISVLLTPDKSGDSSCIAVVEMSNKRDNNPAARVVIGEAFATADEASVRGFELGKKWIDERQPKSSEQKTVLQWIVRSVFGY